MIKLRAFPTLRCVALSTVRTERAVVVIVVPVTVDAGRRCLLEIGHNADVGMTAPTGHFAVFAVQREREPIVIEAREPIDAVVTSEAVRSKVGDVPRNEIGLIVTMTGFAPRPIEGTDVVAVTIGTDERLSIRSL